YLAPIRVSTAVQDHGEVRESFGLSFRGSPTIGIGLDREQQIFVDNALKSLAKCSASPFAIDPVEIIFSCLIPFWSGSQLFRSYIPALREEAERHRETFFRDAGQMRQVAHLDVTVTEAQNVRTNGQRHFGTSFELEREGQ